MSMYEGRDLEVLADMPNYYAWIFRYFARYVRGEMIEYGAGTGTVSAKLLASAGSLTLVEPSANLVRALNDRFGNDARVTIVHASLEEHAGTAPDASFDTVVIVNVLEHINQDKDALTQLFRILKPGGNLLIFVPALQILMSKLDLLHGHFRRYSRAELRAKVEGCGFKVEFCRYFDSVGVVPWFILNTLLRRTEFDPGLVKLNDKVVVPITAALESVVRPLFGKNVILVARKER